MLVVIQGFAFAAWLTVSITLICIEPYRDPGMYVAFVFVYVIKFLGTFVALGDFLLNVVELRPAARVIYDEICRVVGMRHGSLWRAFRPAGRGGYIPKDPARIFSDLFFGWPEGTFMCSYCWAEPALPRRVAQEFLPERRPNFPNKCWLDVENLLPGVDASEAMVEAVRKARFRFVFLSAQYLRSANCNRELAALRDEPGRTLFLIYQPSHFPRPKAGEIDDTLDVANNNGEAATAAEATSSSIRRGMQGLRMRLRLRKRFVGEKPSQRADEVAPADGRVSLAPPAEVVEQLQREGHLTYNLPERLSDFGADDLLRAMIDQNALRRLFEEKSPRINAQWVATASALVERTSLLGVVLRFGPILLLPLLCDALLFSWMLYMVHDRDSPYAFGDFLGGLQDRGPPDGIRALRGAQTPGLVVLLKYVALLLDALFCFLTTLVLPLIQRPRKLAHVPDAGLLLLVLRKLRIVQRRVRVLNVADPECEGKGRLAAVLRTLHEMEALQLLPSTAPALYGNLRTSQHSSDSVGSEGSWVVAPRGSEASWVVAPESSEGGAAAAADSTVAEDGTAQEANAVIEISAAAEGSTLAEASAAAVGPEGSDRYAAIVPVIDLDACASPPAALVRDVDADGIDDALPHCICWSASRGYGAVSGDDALPHARQWAPLVQHTIIGQPRHSDQMIEAVLCEVLRAALTSPHPGAQPTHLVAGGQFEVDTRMLAPPEPDEEERKKLGMSEHSRKRMRYNRFARGVARGFTWVSRSQRKSAAQTHPVN